MRNRFKAAQDAIQAAKDDYWNYDTSDAALKSYTAGDFAIVQALLVVASEIAALTDTLEEYNRNDQLTELEKADERRHSI
jgi:hypothetical protein